jgi:hypothetical protein
MQQEHGKHRRAEDHQKLAPRMRRMSNRVQPATGKTAEDDDRHMPCGQQSRRMTPREPCLNPRRSSPSAQHAGMQHLP